MVAKEVYPEPDVDNNTDLQDLDEAEETLSLCDLAIYNDAAEWDDYSKEDQSSSGDQEEEFFEFFSEDITALTRPAENIIFCGKLIPYKQPVSEKTHQPQDNNTEKHPKTRSLFRWKSRSSSNKSKASRADGVDSKPQKVSDSKSLTLPTSEKYNISVQKVNILTSPTKSRWHLLLFGLMRLPTEMELSDIKNRHHRQNPSPTTMMFRSFDAGEEVTVGKKSRGKGLWRLIRALGCTTTHANAVVKASFGCMPRM
ncbi:hypothetical protein L1049_011633 [Liquidambar formosana]|uniref:Uncharacterized protein n=1 Tax=Liquidambar formosana TaxID=63359 RepID=A0AAP0WZY7_LIQFO